jgi:hypothetical protein
MTEELKKPQFIFFISFILKNELAGYLKLNLSNAQTEEIEGNNIEIERIYILREFQKTWIREGII